jgi:hypothetical protein
MEFISGDRGPKSGGHYSQAVVANGFVFVAGQLPLIVNQGRGARGLAHRRPRSSTAAASSFAVPRIARAPSSPRTVISLKWKSAARCCSTCPGRRCGCWPKPKCAAPDSSATTRQGIKNTISPAEMSEREHAADLNAAFDPGGRRRRPGSSTAAASSIAPIARAPSSSLCQCCRISDLLSMTPYRVCTHIAY